MKKLSGLVAVCVMVALISVASAEITELQPFPDTIYAGSEYTAKYQITNAGDESSPLDIRVSIINEDFPVNVNETDVTVSVDTSELKCSEIAPGNFTCETYTIPTGATINMDICFSSVPNLMPDTNYISTITFTYKETYEPVQKTYRRGGGGGGDTDIDDDGISNIDEISAGTDWRNPCDPNPYNEACYAIRGARPTPTPSPTPTPEVTPGATPTPEETPTPTPGPKPLKDYLWLWYLGLGGIISTLVYLLWRRRRQNQ